MKTKKAEPAWMNACREELMRLDPRYVVVFNARWRHFEGDCTAAQLARHLQGRKFKWAPRERTLQRWLNFLIPIEALHQANDVKS